MPRVPRIHIENALYYVTSRGDNDQDIFKEGSDYTMYIDLLRKCKMQYKINVFAYCLLPNHVHLLLEPEGDATVSQIMHGLNSNYTKYFNGKYARKGHLFQERYRMVLIEKEPNLLNITAYIHLNPKALNIPGGIDEYPYSSYLNYIRGSGPDKEARIDMDKEIKEALKRLKEKKYQDFVTEMPKDVIDMLSNELNKKSIVGSDEFIEKIKSKVENEKQKQDEVLRIAVMRSPITKRFVIIGGTAVIILGVLALYLYVRAAGIKENYRKELENRKSELNRQLVQERNNIVKDIDEKYRADKVSYESMIKRLEIEKQKVKELENKVKK